MCRFSERHDKKGGKGSDSVCTLQFLFCLYAFKNTPIYNQVDLHCVWCCTHLVLMIIDSGSLGILIAVCLWSSPLLWICFFCEKVTTPMEAIGRIKDTTSVKCVIVFSYYYCTIIIIKLLCMRGFSPDLVAQMYAAQKLPSDKKQWDYKEM